MSVTGLRSLSTFAIGFLLTGIISPVFQMVGRSWMAADSWKMKWYYYTVLLYSLQSYKGAVWDCSIIFKLLNALLNVYLISLLTNFC